MSDLVAIGESSYQGVIRMKNFTSRVNSSYSLTYESQVCSAPSNVANDAAALTDGNQLILIQYSYVCLSIKCPQLNSTNCTGMIYSNGAFNKDNIGKRIKIETFLIEYKLRNIIEKKNSWNNSDVFL